MPAYFFFGRFPAFNLTDQSRIWGVFSGTGIYGVQANSSTNYSDFYITPSPQDCC